MVNSLVQDMNIDLSSLWIDVKTLSELKKVTQRAIRLAIRQKKYIAKAENAKGGKGYQICLSSVEPELQTRYIKEYYNSDILTQSEELNLPVNPVQEKIVPENMKRIALARLDLIHLWQKAVKEGKSRVRAGTDFINLYNTGEYYRNIFDVLGKVSLGTLYRWRADLGNTNDWIRLVPQYHYSGSREYRTSLSDEEIKVFMKLLLNQNRFSIGKAIGLTKHIFQKRGQEIMPKDITFRRYANWFRDNHYDKWILAREGQKALRDKVEPYIIRDASILEVGEVLVADGHRLNFQVINPFTGKPCRATLVGFLDWKSGALVGYEIMLEENTQCIASALRNAILKLGKIPKICYQDNGKAFKAKFFTGDKDFEELGFSGVYGKLGIKPVYAAPYNARAKVIERFFKEFQESFEKLLPSYIGSSIEEKPAYLKRNETLHKEIHSGYVPTIEETIRFIDTWLEYKHNLPCPNAAGKTISEVLNEVKREDINEQELDDLMMAMEVKTINRNGIRFLKSDYYDDNLYGIRGKAIIKYSLFDLTSIKAYSMKGEYLCRARRVESTHPMAQHLGDIKDMEDYKQKIVKQRQLRNKTIKAVKELFKIEDVKVLEENLELMSETDDQNLLQDKNLTDKEIKNLPVVKVISEKPLTRPIFNNKYERYEWHTKNGCHSQEDREWYENYKKSDEFKLIYGA